MAGAAGITGAGPRTGGGCRGNHDGHRKKIYGSSGTVVAVRYAAAFTGWNADLTEELRKELRALRGVCQDVLE
jgi:hypothetical protein